MHRWRDSSAREGDSKESISSMEQSSISRCACVYNVCVCMCTCSYDYHIANATSPIAVKGMYMYLES